MTLHNNKGTIQNIADATGAYEAAMNSAGTATEKNKDFIDSIQGKLNELDLVLKM